MTSPNAPSGSSDIKNTGAIKRVNLAPLLKKSISITLGKGDIIDPARYPINNQQEILKSIKNEMKEIRDTDENWSETTDNVIMEMKESEILTEIELFSLPLKNARKNALQRFFSTFKGLNLDRTKLAESLNDLDEKALANLYTSRSNMKKFLRENHTIDVAILDANMYDFREIFASDTIKNNSPDLYKRLEYAALQYKKNGTQPPKSLIKELLGFYDSNFDKKDAICRYFDLTFTLSEALNLEIIDSDTPKRIAEKDFSNIWNNLDEKSRERIIEKIRADDTVEITIEELNTIEWKKFIDGKKITNILTDKVYRRASQIEDTDKNKNDIMSNLTLDENGKIHTSWLGKMKESVGSKIGNISQWTEGNVLVFEDKNGNTHYFQLEKNDIDIGNLMNPGVRLASLEGLTPGSIGRAKGASEISYKDLSDYLSNGVKRGEVMSESELRSRATTEKSEAVDEGGIIGLKDNEKVWDMSDIENTTTEQYLKDAIDRIDPEGIKIDDGKIRKGLTFVSESSPDDHGVTKKGVYTIKNLDGGLITISGSSEGDETVTYAEFVETIEKQKLARIALLDPEKEDESMFKALGKYGINIDNTTIEDGNLVTETEEHIDEGHGHHSTKKTKGKYEFFSSEQGGHIYFSGMKDGFVMFGEYDSSTKLEDVQKAKKAKKLTKKQEKGLYKWRTMRYGSFLHYLEENKLKATTENLLDPHAGHAHEPHEHFEGSLFSKLGKFYSINDIMKGIQNFSHHIEHYFEKTSKLNASRVTLALAKKLPKNFGADLIAQAQSEEVGSVKEIIEKLKEKLGNLNGPHGRTKALHIAHNKDARPEEVAAAMLHMVRGYGQLYAEDIAYAQGSHSFINGFLNSCGFKDEASRKMMKQKARDKFMSDMGNEGGEPTEEELIWGFMKTMDGKYEEYPLAGTVVKAMGGPSGWEKAWRTEGFDGAYEKGIRQGADTVNAEGRISKGLSALITHEYHTAIGFMEKAAGKSPDPSIQTIPVVWALAGYSQYLGTKASQKVKGYGDSMGHTFHAYSFLRNHADNILFRDTFRLALQEISPSDVKNFDKWIAMLQRDNHHGMKDNDEMKGAVLGLAKIWDNNRDKGLHDALQGRSGWLIEKANVGNKSAKAYLKRMDDIHKMNGSENPPGNDNDWMLQYGYDKSPLIGYAELDGKTVLSLERTLKKIRINTHNFEMDKDRKDRLWPSIIERVKQVKEIKDPALRKTQYNQYRKDLLTWFRNAINARGAGETVLNDLKKKSYYKDLLEMGIDPEVIVANGETEKIVRTTSGEDFTMWIGGGRGSGNHNHETVAEIISDTSDKANRRMYQQGKSINQSSYEEEGNKPSGGNYVLQSEDSD